MSIATADRMHAENELRAARNTLKEYEGHLLNRCITEEQRQWLESEVNRHKEERIPAAINLVRSCF